MQTRINSLNAGLKSLLEVAKHAALGGPIDCAKCGRKNVPLDHRATSALFDPEQLLARENHYGGDLCIKCAKPHCIFCGEGKTDERDLTDTSHCEDCTSFL